MKEKLILAYADNISLTHNPQRRRDDVFRIWLGGCKTHSARLTVQSEMIDCAVPRVLFCEWEI